MAVSLTEKEFSQHLNTKFWLDRDGEGELALELVEVKPYPSTPAEKQGMERFSAFFRGPDQPQLPQRLYSLEHERMGKFDIFLVPVGRNQEGVLYEAVFNYFL
jgi:hypothetical protein